MSRDCYNCNNLDGSPSVCKLSTKDIQTCKENPSRPFWTPKKQVNSSEKIDPYNTLNQVLKEAFLQASSGKGKERHATNNNYEDQVICVIGRLLRGHPYGSHAYQVIKKTIEAGRLYYICGPQAAYDEVLGAINYAAAMNILIQEDIEPTTEI